MVFGEVLACSSSSQVEAVHALLLDCADLIRIDRIRSRDGVDSTESAPEMNWKRWEPRRTASRWDV